MWLSTALLASEVSLFDMNSWWWQICKGMYWVINAIEMAYNYLVGITPISNNAGSDAPGEVSDILFLNITDARVQKAFLIFFITAAGLLLIFLAIGMIKASFQNDDQLASRGKMLEKSFQAFFIMLLLPIIMYLGVMACGAIIRLISSIMQYTLNSSGSGIAENIHQTCLPPGDFGTLHWDSSYNTMKSNGVHDEYQYVQAILASGVLIYVLIAICTSLVERLVEVVFFYLIGPFVLARTPLDDGGSFKLWKDIVIAKMLSAAGVIISMYLYFILMQNINAWFTPTEADKASTAVVAAKGMVRILFCIGGAFAAKKGALSIAQVISQNTGVSEGMAQGQSLHMLSSGLNLGMSAIRGGMMGFALAGRAGMNGTAALRGATTGSGKHSAPVNATDAFSSGSGKGQSGGNAAPLAATGGGGAASPAGGINLKSGAAGGGAAAPAVDNAASESGTDWTQGLLGNPNAPGAMGQMNQARAAGGGIGTAFMYGGGLIGGAISAGAYAARKVGGAILKPVKWAASKAKGAIKKSAPVQAAKGKLTAMNEKRKASSAAHQEAKTIGKADKLNSSLEKLLGKVNSRSASIDKKYGQGGLNLSGQSISKIKGAQLSSQVRSIDKKVRRLTAAGAANTNVLDSANKLLNTNYQNKPKGQE